MPRATTLSGQSLADAIYAITDRLESEFAAEFIAQMRKLSRRKSLQELLDQIEGGYYSSVATIPASLLSLQIDTSKLNAIARKAMGSSARITNEKVGLNLSFNVRNPTIIEAARNISVDLSTNLSQTSQKILDKVIGDAMEGLVTRREAVKIIESRVGLLPAHSDAVDRYYDTLIQSGATKASAKKLADKYADRLLRYRANTIARTEIARATGIGQAEFWRQAVADGSLPPDAKRVWTTSYDERVCEICGPMNNVEVGIFEQWLTPNGFVDYPSAIHPNCRCSQGIAMSAAQKRLFIGKTDDEKFEQYILSKFNPNHDELGRFTFASGGRRVSQMPKGGAKKSVMRFGDRVVDPSVIDIKTVESKKINGMTINIGMIGDKQHEAYAKYTSPKNGVTYDIVSDRAGNTYAYVEGSGGKPHERVAKLEIMVDALGQGKHEVYEVNTTNSHLRQGLASAMFEVSRTLLGGNFTPNALTAQGSEWWESISKFNPYHDELGRFTSGSGGGRRVSQMPKGKKTPTNIKLGKLTIEQLDENKYGYQYGEDSFEIDFETYTWRTREYDDGEEINSDSKDLKTIGEIAVSNQWNYWEGNFAIRTICSEIMELPMYAAGGDEYDSDGIDALRGYGNPKSELPEIYVPTTHAMMEAVVASKKTTYAVSRAMVVRENSELLLMDVGSEITMPLSGFSPNKKLVDEFRLGGEMARSFSEDVVTPVEKEVIFVLKRGARAVEPYDWEGFQDGMGQEPYEGRKKVLPWEIVTQGKFKVVSTKDLENGVEITIEHTEVFNIKTGKYEKV